MSKAVKLTVITGPHNRVRYCFRQKTKCVVGRASDCEVHLSGYSKDRPISRHHCRLDIDPPKLWVTDLGSTNGTFVNGIPLSSCEKNPESTDNQSAIEIKNDDILSIGGTTFQINVIDCPYCLSKGKKPQVSNENEASDPDGIPECEGDCLFASDVEVLLNGTTVLWKEKV